MKFSALPFLLLLLVFSCKTTKNLSKSQKVEVIQEEEMQSKGYKKAIVKDMTDLDGCTYLVMLEDSKEYLLPLSLLPEFREDQLKVWLTFHPIKPVASTCMKGQQVAIYDIKRR